MTKRREFGGDLVALARQVGRTLTWARMWVGRASRVTICLRDPEILLAWFRENLPGLLTVTDFIDLSRRFRDLTRSELEEPELLASMSERELLPFDGWPELLKQPRVLILAEAGSGKTMEMREQAKRLAGQRKFAFFVALESLDRETLTGPMSADEERAFEAWSKDGHSR